MSQEICWYHSAELPPSPSPSRLPTAVLKRIKYWSTFQKKKKRKKKSPWRLTAIKIMKSFPGRSRFVLEGQPERWDSDPLQPLAVGSGAGKLAAPQGAKDGKGCNSHTCSTRAAPVQGGHSLTPALQRTCTAPPASPQELKTAPTQPSPASIPLHQEKLERYHCQTLVPWPGNWGLVINSN